MIEITRNLPRKVTPRGKRTGEVVQVLGYARVSSDTQVEKGYSIDMQIEHIETWCRRKFGDQPYRLEIERDEGFSGRLSWEPPTNGRGKHRPGLRRVVEKLRAGEVDWFVFYRLDRVARNQQVQLQFLAEFFGEDSPLELASVTEPIDYKSLAGKLSTQVLSASGEFFVGQLRQILKDSKQARRNEGYPTGQMPYGWRRVPRTEGKRSGLEPHPEQLPWVGKVFELALSGWGLRTIAREMLRLGAPPPGQTGRWDEQKVWRMLHQPLHAGLIWDRDTVRQGVHWEHRVVEPTEFQKVQQLLQARHRERVVNPDRELLPLYRVGRCGTCGGRLTVVEIDAVIVYRCPGSAYFGDVSPPETGSAGEDPGKAGEDLDQPTGGELPTRPWCPGWQKAAEQVDQELVRLLQASLQAPEFVQLAETEAQELLLREGRTTLKAQRDQSQRALQGTLQKQKTLLELHLEGVVDRDHYRDKYAALLEDAERTRQELSELERRLEDTASEAQLLARIREQLPDLPRVWSALHPEERRQLVRELTEYVILERIDYRQARLRVKVHFLPEQGVLLASSRSLEAGYRNGVEHLTPRELALLHLFSLGKTLPQIAAHWKADPTGIWRMGVKIRRRLEVGTLAEAAARAAARIQAEREQLPLDEPSRRGHQAWRPSQAERITRVLEGYRRGLTRTEIAQQEGLSLQSVRNYEWKACRQYGVKTLAEALEQCAETQPKEEPKTTGRRKASAKSDA
jgi:DNA invertase Pin-like site-specific DNA recombinase/DNA-binding NarL/FixJ family response regulator